MNISATTKLKLTNPRCRCYCTVVIVFNWMMEQRWAVRVQLCMTPYNAACSYQKWECKHYI